MTYAALFSLAERCAGICESSNRFSTTGLKSRLAPGFLWLALVALPAHAVDYIYWTDINSGTQGIRRADLSGTLPLTAQDVATSADGLEQPYGVAVDVTGAKVYWTDPYAGMPPVQKLQRMNMDGSGAVEDVRTGLDTPRGVALDTDNGKVYWADENAQTINRANLDGTSPETLVTLGGSASPYGIALDVAGGKMYWTDNFNGYVQRANLDGSSPETLVTGLTSPKGIVLDLTNSYIYWATGNAPTSAIYRTTLDGNGLTSVISTSTETIYDVAVHVASNYVYWTGSDAVRRANLALPVPQEVISGAGIPRGLALAFGPATYTISGRVFNDANFSGTAAAYDGGVNDVALQNVDVELYDNSNVYIGSTTTAADGTYSFTGLANGTYKVRARSASIVSSATVPELAWANGGSLHGGQDPTVADTATADNAGPGDTYVGVTVSGATVGSVDFGFAWNLIVNVNDSGQGSLRQFITNANAGVLGAGNLTSQFRIMTSTNQTSGLDSWWRITLATALPVLTTANLVLDARTQTTNVGNTNSLGPEVEVTRVAGCASCNGFNPDAAGIAIRGFAINNFTLNGVLITSLATGNVIAGNYIGTDAVGAAARPNTQDGIYVEGDDITIGGTGANDGNVLSGNGSDGVEIFNALNATIVGNAIGVNALRNDATVVGNTGQGINFNGASSGTVGGTTAAHANVIGNNASGVRLGGTTSGVTVQGNYIGSNAGGQDLGHANYGIIATTTGSGTLTLGGTTSGAGNVIRYNGLGTYTDAANATTTIAGNTIANQTANGIYVLNGVALIQKNLVTNNDGTAIYLANADNSKIYQNTVHGNSSHGIGIASTNANITVRNNITSGNGVVSGTGYGVNDPNNLITSLGNNIYFNNQTGTCTGAACPGTGSLTSDPLYVNAAAGDFTLTECTSPAINAGADLGVDQPDMNGATAGNFTGSAPDIGAFESSCATAHTVSGNFNGGDGYTVRVLVNGAAAGSGVTAGGGNFSISASYSAGDRLLIFVDSNGGAYSTLVTVAANADLTGLLLYNGYLFLRHDNGGTLTNTDIAAATGSYSDSDIPITLGGGNSVTSAATITAVPQTHAYAPGAAFIAPQTFMVTGTFNGGSAAITVGTLTIGATGAFTSTSGTLNIVGNLSNSGTFTHNSGTVTLSGTGTQSIAANGATFNNLTVTNATNIVSFSQAFATANFTATAASTRLTFAGGATYAISDTLELNGQATGTRIQLRSTDTSQYILNVTGGDQVARYVDVQYAAASGNDITAFYALDSGNNDNGSGTPQWVFAAQAAVITAVDGDPGGLRDWLNNADAGDTIVFDPTVFPIGAPATIALNSTLPVNQGSITLDASNAGVIIDGGGTVADCLTINSNNNTVRGLRIQNCANDGIYIQSGTGNQIGGDRSVGSGPNGQGNTIVSNTGDGIQIDSNTNTLHGNYIGTDNSSALPNGGHGVLVAGGSNSIGGSIVGNGNVISGNGGLGVHVTGDTNLVLGNAIGTNAAGTAAIPNVTGGVRVTGTANNNNIGYPVANGGNTISGNTGYGVRADSSNPNFVSDNYIGTSASAASLPNGSDGVLLVAGQLTVGNAGQVLPNVIGPNTGVGIRVSGGTLSFANSTDLNDDITLTAGAVNLGSATLNLAGDWSRSGTTVLAGTSTVVLDGAATQSVTSGGAAFNNVTVTNNAAVVTFADALSTANLTATTASTQLTFTGGTTNTITGTLNLNGQASGTRIQLRSTNTSQYTINVTGGAQTVRYVDVQYSAASGNDITALNSLDGGNNDTGSGSPQWVFGTAITAISTADSGAGSLRDALTGAVAGSVIDFDTAVFPPGTPATITLASALPTLTQGNVTIDASNAGVILSGAAVTDCLTISSSNNVVRGLRIQNCLGNGITISGGTNNTIGGDRTVGSASIGQGNIIVSNGSNGIHSEGDQTFIYGNNIGTDGSADLGNGTTGVSLFNSDNNVIGGSGVGQRNIISGNGSRGINIQNGNGTTIRNNYIGTNAAGTAALANGRGIMLEQSSTGNIIGGSGAGEGNLISGNTTHGIVLANVGTSGNSVLGNTIGTNAARSAALQNGFAGISVESGATGNTIGGTASGAGNVIAGNAEDGIVHSSAGTNAVLGNFIGNNGSGGAIPNADNGIEVSAGTVTVGDAAEAQSNVIGPNTGYGIETATGATLTLAGTVDVNDDVSLGGGTLNMGTATLQVAGNWNKGSGTTLNAGTSTLNLDGAGTQNFNNNTGTYGTITVTNASVGGVIFQTALTTTNLTATTASTLLTFAGGSTYTISGTLNLNGQATGTRIQLRSTNTSQYTFNVTGGAQTVRYVDVQYSAASGNDITALTSLDGGNNDNGSGSPQWVFGTTVTISSTADSGAGTLRDALTTAAPGDTIVFDPVTFPPGAPATITLGSTLPMSQGGITLDASAAGVAIDGGGTVADCLTITSSNNTVQGLRIQNCSDDGIYIQSGTGNTIGGDRASGEGNVIVGNQGDGIQIDAAATGTLIHGNFIGTDGTADLGNTASGINVASGSNTIGAAAAGYGNVISGNNGRGILVSAGNNTVIAGNLIGTDAAGTAALGNGSHGIELSGAANPLTIGGVAAGAGNVISGNGGSGIYVHFTASTTSIYGNYIGTNSGGAALPNTAMGVRVEGGQVTLGDAAEAQSNVIGPNGGYGIYEFLVTSVVYFGGTVDVNDDVYFSSGFLELGSATLQVAGNLDYSVVDVSPGTSTVVLDGTAAQTVTLYTQGNLNCNVTCFNNLTVTNSSAPVTITSTTSDALTTVNFTAVTPNTQLVFLGGVTHTISGTLNLNGQAAGTRISLDSTNASQYTFNVTGGPQRVAYVNVQDAVATTNNIIASNSVDGGNNGTGIPQWLFSNDLWVTTTADSGAGSLREALTSAVNGSAIYFDSVVFPAAGPAATITLASALPGITQGGVTVDASNAGAILSGGGVANCLSISSSNNVVRGLRIQNCLGDGIAISSGTFNTIGGDRSVGSGPNGQGNVIVSNGGDGIQIDSNANFVYGNYIGTDGTAALGNTNEGIFIGGASNTVGGTGAGQRNVLSGNGERGVLITGNANLVLGNYIGVNAAATAAVPNVLGGVRMMSTAQGNVIGSLAAGGGNVISGNTLYGIRQSGPNANSAYGNFIGTNAGGAALPNGAEGVLVVDGTLTLGGAAEAQPNVIGPNTGYGIDTLTGTTLNLAGTVDINDDVRHTASTVNLGAATLNLSGHWTNSGATQNVGTSTVVLDGTTTQSVTSGGAAFNNITVTNGTAVVTFADALSTANLTATAAGTQLGFAGGTTHTITGTLNLNGQASGTRIQLRSTNTSQYTFNVTGGAQTVRYVDVQYSAAAGNDITALNSLDGGNNDTGTGSPQWVFATSLTVTTTADSGAGSLREALTNAVAGNVIDFDTGVFPPGAPATITLASALPNVSQGSITLDASNAGVAIDGGGVVASCITIASSNNVVRGLRIQNCASYGINVASGTNNTLGGDRTVGSGPNGAGNTVVSNGADGITITSGGNFVYGTYMGTDGTNGLGNVGDGIHVSGSGNTIGGLTPGTRNVVSGNGAGIHIYAGDNNIVQNNFIGTNAAGTAAIGNGWVGIGLEGGAANNVIGGTTAAQRNVIAGSTGAGVTITGAGSDGNTILGNSIGTDATASAALGNGNSGVRIVTDAQNNVIGATAAGGGNVIAGNSGDGIRHDSVNANTVLGNFIGVNAALAAIPNTSDGIEITAGTLTVGDAVETQSNFIGAHSGVAIRLTAGALDTGGTVQLRDDVLLTAGTVSLGSATVTSTANWTSVGATVVPGSSTLNLTGSGQSVSGNNAFFNLTKTVSASDTLTFADGSTQTVSGALTLTGTATATLTLRSVTPGTSWNLTLTGGATHTVQVVDVRDSNAGGGLAITAYGSTDSGNNVNWLFPAAAVATSLLAEVTPGAVGYAAPGATLTLDLLPTLVPGDIGFDRIDITLPAGWSNGGATGVSVGGSTLPMSCPTPGAGTWCASGTGASVTVALGSAIATSLTNVRVTLNGNAPAAMGSNAVAASVTNSAMVYPAVTATAGNADGDASDANALDVAVQARALTGALAEVSPIEVTAARAATFILDARPTFGAGDSGVDQLSVTLPSGYANIAVSSASVNGVALTSNCPAPATGQYCATVAAQALSVQLGDRLTTDQIPLQLTFTADAPAQAGATTLGVAFDDSATLSSAQAASAGNADGDAADANTLTVTVLNAVESNQSSVAVEPQIVLADGVSSATITVTLRDIDRMPMPNKTVHLTTDRNVVTGVGAAAILDLITQPATPTDGNGAASGAVASATPGTATVTATEAGDNIAVAQRAVIYFTQGRVLDLDKKASRAEAVVGDVVTYSVELRNATAQDVVSVQVLDRLPPDFKYVDGSARVNGAAVNVTGDARTRVFDVGTIAALADANGNGRADAGEAGYAKLSYQLVVGAGAQPGSYVNTAVARDVCELCLISNEDDARVAVTLDPLLDLGTIVGKVFEDRNGDGRQDDGEPGIAGAMVALDDGTYALTDEHGRYHFPAVRPGQRALKINLQALSDYAQATSDPTQVVTLTPGLLAKANFGVVFTPDTVRIGRPAQFGVQIDGRATPEPLQVQGDVNNLAVLLNGQRVGLPEADVVMNINLLDGVLIEGDRLAQAVEFALSAREPPRVKHWILLITDRDGKPLRRYAGDGAPPGTLAWDGRDDAGKLLRGGTVYMYWLELEYADGSSASSARRNFGVNKQTAVNLNLTGGAFVTGSAQLTGDAKQILKDAARTLREYPEEVIYIEGHTDVTGSVDANQKLSTERAQAARDYLVATEKLPAQRFVVRGYGATRPLADNDSEEGRELNRRIEIHGEVSSVDRARLLDQYRAAPEVRINGQPMAIDSNGRFKANLDDAQELNVEAVDRQGRTARGRLAIPPLERLEPTGRSILAHGSDTPLYRVPEANGAADDIVAYHVVQGQTTPGNRVMFDGQESVADANGTFRLKLPLRRGANMFGIAVRNAQDAVRIARLHVDAITHQPDGRRVVALPGIPNLAVNLPRDGQQLRSPELVVSGTTDAGNRVTINGTPVAVQPDGRFTAQVALPKGSSAVVVDVEDQEGNPGHIERTVEVTEEQLFLIAIADAKFGELRAGGRLEGAGLETRREYYREGRVAYYLKGRVAGKYLVRSAYDSGETGFDRMFRDLDQGQEQRLLANLDPDKLYPVYGDDSTLVHDAQSLGKFFLALDSDELSALIGNFPLDLSEPELAAYRRTFYGARIAWQSLARSPYGAPTTRAMVFGAEVREVHVRDELRATGGALYYLSRREVIEGSEQIAIVVRDKDTGLPRSRAVQIANTDYTINYDQGRILLARPVASVSGDGALIDQNVLGGHPVYIEVDYEARADAFEKTAQGARVRQQLGDHVAIGATAVSDELAAGRYELGGVDAELRLARNTRVVVEAAGSSGGATPLNRSNDGGLSFGATTPQAGSDGQAWKAAVNVDVNEFVTLPVDVRAGAYVKQTDDGFQSAGHDASNAGTRTGIHVVAGADTNDKITLRHERDDLTQSAEPASLSMAQWQHSADRWQVTTEVQARNGANAGSGDDATLGAAQIRYRHSDAVTSRVEHQHTLDGARNNQSTVGAEVRVTERFDVDGSVTRATDGESAQATASWRIGRGRAYVSERALDSRAGASTVTVVGGESAVGERSRVYSEYQWERQPDSERGVSVVGTQSQWEPAQGWLLDASGEHGAVDASLHDTQRYALGVGVGYRSQRGWRAFTREEYRKEWGATDTHQWLTVNGAEIKLNPDYTLLGKLRRSRTVNDNSGLATAGFDERSIGLAYRPVASDTFNALTRYTVLDERPPPTAPGDTPADERSEIVSAEWSWDFSRWAEWVDKQAFKTKRYAAAGLAATTTHTWLSIHRLNVHVHAAVDAGLEYRTLTQREADDRRGGWLVELGWKIARHVRVGAGYNFTDFSDNEFSDNDYSVRGRFVRVQAVY